jgi:ABC-type multidrug transport system ATPase subunit
VVGTRQALLNLGNGFNSEATLLENIFLRATAMGLPAKSIRDLAMSILEFAELTDIAGRRMSTLSSGQRMRLGFAIATSVRSEILLLDEWLGTGDAHFVKKARERLTDHVHGSKIVVVASHNQTLTTKLCNRGLVLDKGRLVYFGALDKAMREYQKLYPKAVGAKPVKPKPASPSKDSTSQPKAGESTKTPAVVAAKASPTSTESAKRDMQLSAGKDDGVSNSGERKQDVAAN